MVYLRYLIMANKPRIRFRGFTEDWEQRKLGDLAEIVRGASPRPISDPKWFDNNSDVGWLRIADVTAQDGRIRYLEQKISELGQEKTRVVKIPHLLLSIAATVGKPVINYVPTGVHDGFLIFLNPKFNILYTFWWLEMFREKWNKYGQPGSQVNLNSDLVKNQVINIPNEKEQEKISSFLESLDKIITLHQHKLKKLNLAKKALLQKLFPRNGSQFPVVRFKGFTDAWEQRKLSDITEVIMGQSPSSKNYTDNPNDNILVQGNADLKDGKVIPRLWTKEITKTIDKDGIILTVRAPVGDVAKTDYKVVLGRGVAGIKGNDYIYHFLQKLQNNQYWVSLSSGSTFESINSNDIKDLIIDIPSIEEQTKISILLNNVNSIITLHQHKLKKLNLAKKALLQKLFPRNGK